MGVAALTQPCAQPQSWHGKTPSLGDSASQGGRSWGGSGWPLTQPVFPLVLQCLLQQRAQPPAPPLEAGCRGPAAGQRREDVH